MDEYAIVFLVPHFNVHGDGIGDFLYSFSKSFSRMISAAMNFMGAVES